MGTSIEDDQLAPRAERAGRPWLVTGIAILLGIAAIAAIAEGVWLSVRPGQVGPGSLETLLGSGILAALLAALAHGMWMLRNWARVSVLLLLGAGLLYLLVTTLFDVSARVFAGESVVPLGGIVEVLVAGLARLSAMGAVPGLIMWGLIRYGAAFEESPAQRAFVDRGVRRLLFATALSAIIIVFLIIVFTMTQAWQSIAEIGPQAMLLGTVWRPGAVIGAQSGQFGLLPMIYGSVLCTFGAIVLGVPLSVGTAILLAEVAPPFIREIVRPAIELLAGIPSVVYGLFGMVVLAPLIRRIQVPYNSGFGLLNASIILAVMIIPTITNIAEDAIRAVPRGYKEGALALGATHWQTIYRVILPGARSGIVAAVILGIGRALGETMAMIMVIGNSIAIPTPLTSNPLTLFLSSARTLTGNIAVEINYAAGVHRSALFFTGVLLFLMILLVNSLARFLMRERS